MASGLNTLWQIVGWGKWEQWQIWFSWAPGSLWMVTAPMKLKEACSLEEKLWSNLNSILKKQRHQFPIMTFITWSKLWFTGIMYGCESWTIKKVEQPRIDAFEQWCRRRLLGVPWTARRSNQSILKEISPEYSLQGQMLNLKPQSFGHLMGRVSSLEKPLVLVKT